MNKLIILGILLLLLSCTTIYSHGVVQQSENTYLIGVRGKGWDNVRAEVKRLAEGKCPGYKILSTKETEIINIPFVKQRRIYWTIECPEEK